MNDTPDEVAAGIGTLLEVARTGSATRAAHELKTTAATVLRRLGALERALGARLFDRSPSGLLPTPALERVLPWAEQAASALGRMKDELAGLEREPVGSVRLALLPGLASFLVTRGLDSFLKQHPGLTLELAPASAVVDLTRREADLALRTIRPETGDLVAQRLVAFPLAVMVAPSFARRHPKARLRDLPWLTFSDALSSTPESTWLRENVPDAHVVLRAPELQSLLSAAQAGVGALVIAEPLGHVAGLVKVRVRAAMPEGALWIVAHRALRPVPRVAAVWDWLVRALGSADGRQDRARTSRTRATP
jgi:DNA-binding transcriptional LysR family regulator